MLNNERVNPPELAMLPPIVLRPAIRGSWLMIAMGLIGALGMGAALTSSALETGGNLLPSLCLVASLYCVLQPIIVNRTTMLQLDDDKLTLEYGVFNRKRAELCMRKVGSVVVQQSLVQRVLGIGDIEICSLGGVRSVSISNVGMPYVEARLIRSMRQNAVQNEVLTQR